MKMVIGFLSFMLGVQLIFDAMMFNFIVHGEVAWRWQQAQSMAFLNSADNYPGYYCGQHNCTMNNTPPTAR